MEQYMTIKEFMQRSKLSRPTVWRMLRRGDIEAIKVGRNVRLPLKSVEEWENRQPVYQW